MKARVSVSERSGARAPALLEVLLEGHAFEQLHRHPWA